MYLRVASQEVHRPDTIFIMTMAQKGGAGWTGPTPVWNLTAKISSFVFLPSPIDLSVLPVFCYWPVFLFFTPPPSPNVSSIVFVKIQAFFV